VVFLSRTSDDEGRNGISVEEVRGEKGNFAAQNKRRKACGQIVKCKVVVGVEMPARHEEVEDELAVG